MSLRSVANCVNSAAFLIASIAVVAHAQVKTPAHTNSATHVAAEMSNGSLNPSASKPGDMLAVTLKEDVRSNGELVFRKGTTITGVIKNVTRAEGKGDWKSEAQSLIEIEWLVPAPQAHGVQGVSFALQSVIQINHASTVFEDAHNSSSDELNFVRAAVPHSSTTVNGRSNVALLSMPSVVAVDQQTSASIDTTLGTQTSGQLFKVGHGQLVFPGGSKESVELYSHLTNDTVITSPSGNFEISTGAQLQMLVGVNRK